MRHAAACLLTILLLPAAGCRPSSPPPSIIFVMVDTLRADYLGAYGFRGEVSPQVDALAAESILFRRCFSQSPWTKPAIATLFTSLYPQVHGLTNHEGKYWGDGTQTLRTGVLPDRAVTLAEGLERAGYETAAFVTNPWLAAEYGFSQGFDHYELKEGEGLFASFDEMIGDVEAWFASRDPSEPYFLYLHFMDVHAPYDAPQEDYLALAGSPTVRSSVKLEASQRADRRWKNIEAPAEWASEPMRQLLGYWRTRYASGVRAFDRRFGRLLAWLREQGELDRSVLVFTSDHGEELYEHGDWSHGQNLFEHQLHVPLLWRNPGGRDGGRVVKQFTELVDLMPTLLGTARAPSPEGMQGRDLTPLLDGAEAEYPAVSYATATQRRPGLHSVRTPAYKFIYDIDVDEGSLFDMSRDWREQHDLAADRPEVVEGLRDRLLTHLADSVATGTLEGDSAEIPAELREKLEGLGYLK
jgi:arylsulfatase A-like enzyme